MSGSASRRHSYPPSQVFDAPPDVSEWGHCVTQAGRLSCRLTEARGCMTRVLRELSLSYAVLRRAAGGDPRPRSTSRAPPAPPYGPSSIAPAGPSTRATPPPPLPKSSARVRLHLKPGQKGTKQLLAQYGDRLICVRYRYDAQRKKRLKTVEILVAERDWEPPRPGFTPNQIVGCRARPEQPHCRRTRIQ